MNTVKKPLNTKVTKEHKEKKFNPLTFVYFVPFLFKYLFVVEA